MVKITKREAENALKKKLKNIIMNICLLKNAPQKSRCVSKIIDAPYVKKMVFFLIS